MSFLDTLRQQIQSAQSSVGNAFTTQKSRLQDRVSRFMEPQTVASYTKPPEEIEAQRQKLRQEIDERSKRVGFYDPAPVQAQTSVPTPVQDVGRFSPYLPQGVKEQHIPTMPTGDAASAISRWFGDDSTLETQAIMTAFSEQWGNPYQARSENVNRDGSIDRGLFQINSNTFADWASRRPDLLEQYGLSGATYDDMYDPEKNAAFARMLYDIYQNWGQWYGPRNIGYNY